MFFSHVAIGNFLYQEYGKLEIASFAMDRKAFVYGNIMPDVTKLVFLKHQVSDTYDLYLEYLNKAKDSTLNRKERSEALGIAIHFICDYFCKYHSRKPFADRNLFFHFCYELWLHYHVKVYIRLIKLKKIIYPYQYEEQLAKISENKFQLEEHIKKYDEDQEKAYIDVKYAFLVMRELMQELLGYEYKLKGRRISIDILEFEGYANDRKVSC